MWGVYILAAVFALAGGAVIIGSIFVRSRTASWAMLSAAVVCCVLVGVMAWLPG
jgi:1,4-dihydroxy-2-naphthoate octaprenyltransferase